MAINFRSAFRGFNREDVVHYLDYLNSKHTEAMDQLSREAENLRQEVMSAARSAGDLDRQQEQLEESNNRLAAMEQELAQVREALCQAQETLARRDEELEQLRGTLEEKEQALQDSEDGRTRLEAQLSRTQESLRKAEDRQPDRISVSRELEAYRRAERTERMARERAEQVYAQTNGVLADATAKVDQAAVKIGEISDHVMSQLDLLRDAVNGSKEALSDAAAGMFRLKPRKDE